MEPKSKGVRARRRADRRLCEIGIGLWLGLDEYPDDPLEYWWQEPLDPWCYQDDGWDLYPCDDWDIDPWGHQNDDEAWQKLMGEIKHDELTGSLPR